MKVTAGLLLAILFYSCTTEKDIVGLYQLKTPSHTALLIKADKSFVFYKVFSEPGPLFFPDSTELNFRTTGTWQLIKGHLILDSDSKLTRIGNIEPVLETVTHNTDITSFSFWNEFDEPVQIRLIDFPGNRTKLHKGNTLSFFAEDFIGNDTLVFHFYGYKPYRWISSPSNKGTNCQYRINLLEEDRPNYFKKVTLKTARKKLISQDKSFALYKAERFKFGATGEKFKIHE